MIINDIWMTFTIIYKTPEISWNLLQGEYHLVSPSHLHVGPIVEAKHMLRSLGRSGVLSGTL